jgi:hypothetical protein
MDEFLHAEIFEKMHKNYKRRLVIIRHEYYYTVE